VTPPTVAIESPASGATVSGALTIVVAASDDIGVGHVDLLIDGVDQGPDTMAPYQFAWDASAAAPGTHALIATATDAAGNTATTSATVTIAAAGAGSGSGSGAGSAGEQPGKDLPGCSLDAGGGGRGVATLVIVVGIALRTSRRRRGRAGSR
jgi:hypothetical protein